MTMLSANYVQLFYAMKITFRFDTQPASTTFLLSYYKDNDVKATEVINGVIEGSTIVVQRKFPAEEFDLTYIATNETMSFQYDSYDFSSEIKFVNEDGVPVTYIEGFPAPDVFQITAKTLDGDIWGTLRYASEDFGNFLDPDIENLDEINNDTRIPIENWWKYTEESTENLSELRKVIIEVDVFERLIIQTWDGVLTQKTDSQPHTSYQGLLDYDALGIE